MWRLNTLVVCPATTSATVRSLTWRTDPDDDRHLRMVSELARRKKCTLGLPCRPCLSSSAPCEAAPHAVQAAVGSGAAAQALPRQPAGRATSSRYRNAPPPPRSPLRRTLRSSVSTSSRGRLHSPAALGGSSSSSLTYWPACGGGGRRERRGRAAECSRFKGRGAARPHQVALAAAGGQHGLSYASAGPQGRWVGGAARLGQLGAARAISRWPAPPGVLLTLEECLPPPSIRAPLAGAQQGRVFEGPWKESRSAPGISAPSPPHLAPNVNRAHGPASLAPAAAAPAAPAPLPRRPCGALDPLPLQRRRVQPPRGGGRRRSAAQAQDGEAPGPSRAQPHLLQAPAALAALNRVRVSQRWGGSGQCMAHAAAAVA